MLMLLGATLLALQLVTPAPVPPDPPAEPVAAASSEQEQQGQNQGHDQKAEAKEPPTPAHSGLRALFGNLVEDVKHLPSMQNVYIAGMGGGLAVAVHPWDQSFNEHLVSHYDVVNGIFAPGKYIGDTPVQVAFSLGTYAWGRAFSQPKVSHLGMDLIQAQVLTELLVQPIKFAVGRERPDHSNNQSFPSGHAAVTFATATVIERHLGWRNSALAYTLASYVAMSRLHDNRHYLSDVVFGAAVGTIAGRTVVHHGRDYWAVAPVSVPGGGVALLVTRRK